MTDISEELKSHRYSSIHMNLDDGDTIAKICRALSSQERIKILRYLCDNCAIIAEIAENCSLPFSTAAHHVHVLEEAGLLDVGVVPESRGAKKVCVLIKNSLSIDLYTSIPTDEIIQIEQYTMPVGNYFNYQVSPPCGIVSSKGRFFPLDDVSSFCDAKRAYAQLIWMSSGYLEYRFPNSFFIDSHVERISFSFEACSEYAGARMDWPSDISVWLNDKEIGLIYSPSDYGDHHGKYTPSWWSDMQTQHGDLWKVDIGNSGCSINGSHVSDESISSLNLSSGDSIRFRIGVKEDAEHCGGLNLFGSLFGDYPQDIVMSVFGQRTSRKKD